MIGSRNGQEERTGTVVTTVGSLGAKNEDTYGT